MGQKPYLTDRGMRAIKDLSRVALQHEYFSFGAFFELRKSSGSR